MRVENSVKNIYSGIFKQIITILLNFLNRTVFIHILGVTYLGVNGLFTNILSILSLAELGIGEAITFNLYKPIANDDKEKICKLMKFYKKIYRIIGLVIFFMGAMLIPFIPYMISGGNDIKNIRIIYLLFLLQTSLSYFYIYRRTFIIANQKNYIVSKINSTFIVMNNAFQIIILLLFKDFILVLIIKVVFTVVENWYISRECIKLYPFLKENSNTDLDKGMLKKIYNQTYAMLLYKISGTVVNASDNIILSIMIGITQVGIYSNYIMVIGAIATMLQIIFTSLTASVGNLNTESDIEKRYFIFKVINFTNFFLYGYCSIVLLIIINPFIEIWIGKEYLFNIIIVLVIILNFYINGMCYAPYLFRQTMGIFTYGKMRPVLTAILNILFSLVLGHYMGIFGILLGTVAAKILTTIPYDPYIVCKIGFKKSPKEFYMTNIKYFLYVVLVSFITIFIIKGINLWINLGFIIKLILASSLPLILFIIIFRKTKEFNYIKSVVIKVFLRRI